MLMNTIYQQVKRFTIVASRFKCIGKMSEIKNEPMSNSDSVASSNSAKVVCFFEI